MLLAKCYAVSNNQCMQLVLKAIFPRSYELLWYLLFGTIAVLVLNISGIIDTFLTVTSTDPDVQGYIDSSLVGVIQDLSAPLNGRLGNSVVWAFMGALAFTLGSVVIAEIQDLLDHSDVARKTPKRQRGPVWTEFIVRVVIRTLALALLLIWVFITVVIIIPFTSRMLLEAFLAPTPYAWGLLALIVGSVTIGLSLYVAAILCRFTALRVRVFSSIT